VQRDRELIDDALFCIAKEMKKEAAIPVTLVYMAGQNFVDPNNGQFGMMKREEFPSNEAAIEQVCTLMDRSGFHSFAIKEGTADTSGEFLWNEPELRIEYDRRMKNGRVKRRV
jgi:hypothetical protein